MIVQESEARAGFAMSATSGTRNTKFKRGDNQKPQAGFKARGTARE